MNTPSVAQGTALPSPAHSPEAGLCLLSGSGRANGDITFLDISRRLRATAPFPSSAVVPARLAPPVAVCVTKIFARAEQRRLDLGLVDSQ